MPAIRYPSNSIFKVANHVTSVGQVVDVLSKSGDIIRTPWLGFICEPALRYINGKHAKLVAIEVSPDDGGFHSRWRKVSWSEFVLGWVIEHYTDTGTACGIYGVVGKDGWPIVMPRNQPAKPRIAASVSPLIAKNSK